MEVLKGYEALEPLKAYSVICVGFFIFIIMVTVSCDYRIRMKAKRQMRMSVQFIKDMFMRIPELWFRTASIYWKTNGLEYHGRHRLEDKWMGTTASTR